MHGGGQGNCRAIFQGSVLDEVICKLGMTLLREIQNNNGGKKYGTWPQATNQIRQPLSYFCLKRIWAALMPKTFLDSLFGACCILQRGEDQDGHVEEVGDEHYLLNP